MTKHLLIPFIALLENMNFAELELAMEKDAAKATVSEVNWPEVYSYRPDCSVAIARSETCLALLYRVTGLDLRATALEDNGHSWEDSCVEFFVENPTDGSYYNFELTCIGSLLASNKRSRHDGTRFTPEQLSRIKRFSTLPHEAIEERDTVRSWTVAMLIPFDLIGVDPDALPEKLRGNFYKCGDLTAHPHFVSWNPVGTPKPDFHRPDFFGDLYLR